MNHSALIIVVVSLVTILIRALPFLLFKGRESKVITYLGEVLPYAIMPMLVVYCLKSLDLFSSNHGLPEIISVIVVILVHLYKRNTLLSIIIGTVVYMLCVQVIFL